MNQLSGKHILLPDLGYRFAKTLLVLSVAFLPLMAFIDYQNAYVIPAYAKVAVLVICAGVYYLDKDESNQLVVRSVVAISLLLMASISAAYKLDSFHGLVWEPVLPLLFGFLVGNRKGAIFSLSYFLIYTMAYFSYEAMHARPPVSIDAWAATVLAYFFVLAVTVLFRVEMHKDVTQLLNVARYDFLTQVFNRCGFIPRMEAEVARLNRYGGNLSLIVVDIDNFKQVNDKCGHAVGDAILIEFSALLEQQTRQSDIVARWGGEEFVILAPNTDLQACADLAEKLRASVEAHQFTSIERLTASFGAVKYQPDEAWEAFLRRGDDLLLLAKREGKNRVLVEKPSLKAKSSIPVEFAVD